MNSHQNIAIQAATDGACSGNPGKGGWGGLILFNDGSEIEIGGSEDNTTNNRMELTAAIKTLEKLKNFSITENFRLRTDSKYLIEGYSNWINNWKKNGWKTSSGKQVLNIDLWKSIDKLRIKGLQMEFVKGHSGDKYNERVDLIATNYIKGIPIQKKVEQKLILNNSKEDKPQESISNLYAQIDLVNKFSQQGYCLNSNEICDLLAIKKDKNIDNFKEFQWRNWLIKPNDDKYWIIKKNRK